MQKEKKNLDSSSKMELSEMEGHDVLFLTKYREATDSVVFFKRPKWIRTILGQVHLKMSPVLLLRYHPLLSKPRGEGMIAHH